MNVSEKVDRLGTSITSEPVVQVVLQALSEGHVRRAVSQFSNQFTFTDNGLGLTFTDKGRLQEFFNKTRELFPDLSIVPIATLQSGAREICEWKLQNAVTEGALGNFERKVSVSVAGVSVVRLKEGLVTNWTDYYDGLTARRTALGAYFTDWIEL
jgi:SnoaL-like domain